MADSDLAVAPGIVLTPLRADQAVAIAALVDESRAEIGRWLPFVWDSHGPADILAFIATVDQRRGRASAESAFVIVADGEIAGLIEMHEPSRDYNVASIGYWLGTRFTGRGLMTQALDRLVTHCFEAHGVHRLEVYAAVGNTKSRKVAERAGFALEAILHDRLKLHQDYVDAALYARFREKR